MDEPKFDLRVRRGWPIKRWHLIGGFSTLEAALHMAKALSVPEWEVRQLWAVGRNQESHLVTMSDEFATLGPLEWSPNGQPFIRVLETGVLTPDVVEAALGGIHKPVLGK